MQWDAKGRCYADVMRGRSGYTPTQPMPEGTPRPTQSGVPPMAGLTATLNVGEEVLRLVEEKIAAMRVVPLGDFQELRDHDEWLADKLAEAKEAIKGLTQERDEARAEAKHYRLTSLGLLDPVRVGQVVAQLQRERDEAREVARLLFPFADQFRPESGEDVEALIEAPARFPWLKE